MALLDHIVKVQKRGKAYASKKSKAKAAMSNVKPTKKSAAYC